MGLETNVAVAFTLEAALLAAQGFSGVTVIPEGKEAEILGSLPIQVLFADGDNSEDTEDFLETFRRWGIRKFRELAVLPEVALSERLGQRGLELQRKACGVGIRTLVPCNPPLAFEEARRIARLRTVTEGHRSLDILHVAAALVSEAEELLTFDERQRKLAQAEGLKVKP